MPNETLLTNNDVYPVKLIQRNLSSPFLIVCDHAGNRMPHALQNRNVDPSELERHIAIDVNAYAVAEVLAKELSATLVSQQYSRLVVDMNRSKDDPDSMPEYSDGTLIPFNQNLTKSDRKARLNELYWPYHNTISELLGEMGADATLIAVHSFTPRLRSSATSAMRNWHVDLMTRTHRPYSLNVERNLQAQNSQLHIGQNQVFNMSHNRDFTIPFHAESRNITNLCIEIRNDLLNTDSQIKWWGQALAHSVRASLQLDTQFETQIAV